MDELTFRNSFEVVGHNLHDGSGDIEYSADPFNFFRFGRHCKHACQIDTLPITPSIIQQDAREPATATLIVERIRCIRWEVIEIEYF